MDKSTIDKAALAKALALVKPALAQRAYLPALTHVRFSGDRATAYNDIAAIVVRAPRGIEALVPGELLMKALAGFGGAEVAVQQQAAGNIKVSSGRSYVTLPTMETDKFPFDVEPGDDAYEIELGDDIIAAAGRCLPFVSNDASHANRCGVTLDADDGGRAVLYSTDAVSISRCATASKVKLRAGVPVFMPSFFVEQLVALRAAFPKSPAALLLLPDGSVMAEFGNPDDYDARLFTRVPDAADAIDYPGVIGRFLDLRELPGLSVPIPDAFDGALSRAAIVLSGEADKRTKVVPEDGSFSLLSQCSMGEAKDRLAAEMPAEGADQPFFVDPTLLQRAAKQSTHLAFLARVAVLSDPKTGFVNIIAHSADARG